MTALKGPHSSHLSVVGAVFARGGSKGVPGKNIRGLAGRPLIAHAIATARATQMLDRLIVSTDDAEIARIAREYGAEVPFMRPAALAQDDTPEWLAWQHAVRTLAEQDGRQMDVLVSVPTTSPLRAPEDIDACVTRLLETDSDIVITVTPAEKSPHFNMVVIEDGRAQLVIPPTGSVKRRQDAPEVFDMTTVAYAARASFVLAADSMFAGKVSAVVVPRERALDIDTEFAFHLAELLLGTGSRLAVSGTSNPSR